MLSQLFANRLLKQFVKTCSPEFVFVNRVNSGHPLVYYIYVCRLLVQKLFPLVCHSGPDFFFNIPTYQTFSLKCLLLHLEKTLLLGSGCFDFHVSL